MKTSFQPGDHVWWWTRTTRSAERPYRGEVISICEKTIKITVDDPEGGLERVIRHSPIERLQPISMFYSKALNQGPAILPPSAEWGRFNCHLEVGVDLHVVRQVKQFENGNFLSYDRTHWVDDFGMIGHARINRNYVHGPWGLCEEVTVSEFEQIWNEARASSQWQQQLATARMKDWDTTTRGLEWLKH